MSDSQQLPQGGARQDIDSQETREWMDALKAVIGQEGADRAHFLIEQLLEEARASGIVVPTVAVQTVIDPVTGLPVPVIPVNEGVVSQPIIEPMAAPPAERKTGQ